MASIRQLPSGSFAVLFRESKKQRSATFDTREEADDFKGLVEKYGAARAVLILTGERPAPSADAPTGPALAEYLDRHIDELTSASPATKENYRTYVESLRGSIGGRPLETVTARDIQTWVASMQQAKKSGKTIKNHLAFVAGALNRAVETGELASNPCKGVRGVTATRSVEPVFLTPEQVHGIADRVTPKYRPFVLWLAGTGMRFSEATALTVGDIDVAAGTARVNKAWKRVPGSGVELGAPKSRRSIRTVNFSPKLLEGIDMDRPADELLFQSTVGTRVNIDTFRVTWDVAVKGVVPRPRIHDLRHTCASLMIAGGVPLPAIQAHLGHESIQTTVGTYGSLDRSAGEKAAAAIGAAFGV